MLEQDHSLKTILFSDSAYPNSSSKKCRSESTSETLSESLYSTPSLHKRQRTYIYSSSLSPIRTLPRSPNLADADYLQFPPRSNTFEEKGGETGEGYGFHYESLEDLCS